MEQISMNATHAFARIVEGKNRNALFVYSLLYGKKEKKKTYETVIQIQSILIQYLYVCGFNNP